MRNNPKMVLLVLSTMLMSSFVGCIEPVKEIFEEPNKAEPINPTEGQPTNPSDYPKLQMIQRSRAAPTLVSYNACDDLLDDLRGAVFDEALVALDQSSYWQFLDNYYYRASTPNESGTADDGVVSDTASDNTEAAPSADSSAGDSAGAQTGATDGDRVEGEDYSGTNNQESGVDEADFMKTDGDWIYLINNDKLVILGVPEFGQLDLISNMTIEGTPREMMLNGSRLVVISTVYAYQFESNDPIRNGMLLDDSLWNYRWQSLVKFTVIDVTNRSDPQMERQMYIEGNHLSARLVNGTVRAVTHISTYINGLQTYPNLPSDYWQIQDRDQRMAVWNSSVQDALQNNRDVVNRLMLADFAPRIHERTDSGVVTYPISATDCSEFASTTGSAGRGFTTITTLGLLAETVQLETDHITSTWSNVYASQDMMILAEPANNWWWYWRNSDYRDETNIHAFDISSPSETSYIGSGRVDGTVQDQFSLSEYNGTIRVASTSSNWGRWWMETDNVDIAVDVMEDSVAVAAPSDSPSSSEGETTEARQAPPEPEPACQGTENRVTILQADANGTLANIGKIGGIACGETIWSARFIGERGYLVTFRNIDPLWVIDLSEPTAPTILGELEVPGVSTYIHPVDENTLMTIGIGPANEDGTGLDWSKTQISLFDVSDPTNPILADTELLVPGYVDENCSEVRSCGWSWSSSEATYEHKAFTYWAPKDMLAVPLSTHRYVYDTVTIDGRTYSYSGYEFVSMLKMINVDAENQTLSLHGTLNHSAFYNGDDGYGGWWSGTTSIRRSVFMGDFIYSFSSAGAMVHRVDNLSLTASVDLPGYEQRDPYYYEDGLVAEGDAETDESAESEGDDGGSGSSSSGAP